MMIEQAEAAEANRIMDCDAVKFCRVCGGDWWAADLDRHGCCPWCRSFKHRVLIAVDWLGRKLSLNATGKA